VISNKKTKSNLNLYPLYSKRFKAFRHRG